MRLDAGDMGGAGLERREAPPPIMAAEVQNTAAGQDDFVPINERSPTRMARTRRNCFRRFQETRIAIAEILDMHGAR
jgi:hypothetical protein